MMSKAHRIRLMLLACVFYATSVLGHSRWGCPTPRSANTDIKTGPCGSDNGDFTGDVFEISPGPMTVIIEESIAHNGAPWRISLSEDGNDDSSCVLLDHIPHNAESAPTFSDESTWTKYKITIDIPDVSCEKCSLHMANPMTDKIGDAGSQTGVGCTDPGTCDSVYHSCSLSLKINGTTPRDQYECPGQLPEDWPTTWTGDDGASISASVAGLYRRESATWSSATSFIDDSRVPSKYKTQAGSLCGGDGGDSSSDSVASSARSAMFVVMMVLISLFAIFGAVLLAKFGRPAQG